VETSSSSTLPEGRWLAYLKVDHAKSQTGIVARRERLQPVLDARPGLRLQAWLSAYLFQPYNIKVDEGPAPPARAASPMSR